jgi:nucleoside-diphosphate-sugar epimerase
LIQGDVTEPARVRAAVQGVDTVLHSAAKVGDWGPVDDYRAVNVDGLRCLLDACRGQSLRRFVHLSTLGVYEARHHHGTDETVPPPAQHMDGYTQSKVEAETLALKVHREFGLPVVVLRPGFIYGPRDRTLLPRLIENIQRRKVRYIGSGKQLLNCIYVGNLTEAVFLAAEQPAAVGQVYNLTDSEPVSRRRFLGAIVQGLGLPRLLPVPAPLWLARFLAWWQEGAARRRNAPEAPQLTQARIKFLGLNLDFSIDKARRELGYQPVKSFDQAMAETLAWYRQHLQGSAPEAARPTPGKAADSAA